MLVQLRFDLLHRQAGDPHCRRHGPLSARRGLLQFIRQLGRGYQGDRVQLSSGGVKSAYEADDRVDIYPGFACEPAQLRQAEALPFCGDQAGCG
ncbi:MAG TPA: hypothetical protein VF940_31250 [Streptosporangiaceae bacterium]